MSVQNHNETFCHLGCCLSWPSASCQLLDLLTPDWGDTPAICCSDVLYYGSVSTLLIVKMSSCSESCITAVLFPVGSFLLQLKKLKIINLNMCLLDNGSFVRCFIVLWHRQRKLWKYPGYLDTCYLEFFKMSSLSFMKEMRRMRAARLKRSNITKPQGTLFKSTERSPQTDSKVSQITRKAWPLGFIILGFEL